MTILEYLATLDIKRQARLVNILSVWNWPRCIEEYKPARFTSMSMEQKSIAMREAYTFLANAVGKKETARDWHMNELGSTDEQFEMWWETDRHKPPPSSVAKILTTLQHSKDGALSETQLRQLVDLPDKPTQ